MKEVKFYCDICEKLIHPFEDKSVVLTIETNWFDGENSSRGPIKCDRHICVDCWFGKNGAKTIKDFLDIPG